MSKIAPLNLDVTPFSSRVKRRTADGPVRSFHRSRHLRIPSIVPGDPRAGNSFRIPMRTLVLGNDSIRPRAARIEREDFRRA
jgi:hypothetical protein